MNATETIQVIERETRDGQYDMGCDYAIIEHPRHGRLLLIEGFGGMDDLRGGAYRWCHGWAIKLQPGDTLASLQQESPDYCDCTILEIVRRFGDASRPVLDWDGHSIQAVASAAGL